MDKENSRSVEPASPIRDNRLIFLLPPDSGSERGQMSLWDLWRIVWQGRLLIIAITAVFTLSSVVYALLATQWFRAEVVLITTKRNSGLTGQMGNLAGLASLAGVKIDQQGDNAEALAVLRSRDFARAFIEEMNLIPVLFADDWDAKAGRWKSSNPEDWPDVRDAVRYFERVIYHVTDDKKNGLVTLSIEWTDRKAAAGWADQLVLRINDLMRQRSLAMAEANVKYLRGELAATNVVALQQPISRLLENELQTLMLARGNEEFAFRVVDRTGIPKWRSRPKRTLLVALFTIGGGILSVLTVFVMHGLAREFGSKGKDPAGAIDQPRAAAGNMTK